MIEVISDNKHGYGDDEVVAMMATFELIALAEKLEVRYVL